MDLNPYLMFETSTSREVDGVWLDYTAFEVQVARAGGENQEYNRAIAEMARDKGLAFRTNKIEEAEAQEVLAEIWSKTVLKNWRSKKYGDGLIPGRDGSQLPFSPENAKKLLLDLPNFFRDLRQRAQDLSNFLLANEEEDQGN